MKKVIPFSKTVHFKTMIAEVTDIEIKHTLKATDDQTIEGDILVDGTYKMTEASQLEEEFHYTLPFTIEVDDKYDIQSADIGIHDFYFEIINEEDLKVNVELEITQVEEKQPEEEDGVLEEARIEAIEPSQEESEEREDTEAVDHQEEENEFLELEQVPKKIELLDGMNPKGSNSNSVENTPNSTQIEVSEETETKTSNSVSSIFSSINQEETFVTYYVYIVREQDTVESIIEKYQTTREALSSYNDLAGIKAGSKIIIPCSNE
ncbi:MAG: LysM peptidoglycan-binding domain-containing protein [Bacilli bacterium]|nr:LysM peptidoglycan-binding domain-containing protein [Bacilli bacterium]